MDDSVGENNNVKSDDTSLKSLQVNDYFIEISENMTYETIDDKVNIVAIPNDNNATINYEGTINLVVGDNIINIVVIAENGDELEYKLNIIRNEEVDELSNNTNIVIKVDAEEIDFDSYISDVINITNGVDSLNITYELEDENSSVEIIGNEDLKVGENEITIKVTAENGEVQEYKIIVDKNSKTEDVIYTIIALGIMVGAVYGVVVLIRKFRKK
ncbi:MAG TPA: cadherin-like beta sandwich domain-containing protein [Candidatus Onthocola stercorigallinarum]|nr:cadherin-like beta sandwich domain-containing protein [Candidatus Onthocola stercorigallinarum]